jgi:hypothetical protein
MDMRYFTEKSHFFLLPFARAVIKIEPQDSL